MISAGDDRKDDNSGRNVMLINWLQVSAGRQVAIFAG